MAVKIGLKDVVYALLTDDGEATEGEAVYSAVKDLKGAISANFSPNASNDTLFADDGPYDTASTLGAMTLELNVADLPNDVYAELIGAKIDNTTKVVVNTSDDTPPYVAVGMKVAKSNGEYRYIWYLKGKFAAPDESNQTKADSISWNTPTISGNFLKRVADGAWRFAVDTDDEDVPEEVIDNFFDSPNVTDIIAVTPTAVTFTAEQTGGTAGDADSTAIAFVFDVEVEGLQASHITITPGTGAATKGTLTGTGKNWSLEITDPEEGNVKVKISGLAGYSFPSTDATVAVYAAE